MVLQTESVEYLYPISIKKCDILVKDTQMVLKKQYQSKHF